ncbi:MAG: deoxyribonuclease IV [Armatimonadota bacterium]|nr:deoxyribonuclease IV [bacterium]MDW8321484.1 deoxyribonuclease IV [Armatimonadota bacterium]
MTQNTRLLGAHMPTTGGLYRAITSGYEIGCTAIQLFTASPRQWRTRPLSDEDIAAFARAREETGIDTIISHDSYLINLAAPDKDILQRSREAFLDELQRAEALGIPWVVTHMGAYLNSSEEEGLQVLGESVRLLLKQTEGMKAGIALETTAGQGTNLGYRFEHLARVIELAGGSERVGVCFDTCHVFVAGYDIRTQETLSTTLDEFDRVIGLERLKVIHLNDAKKPLGSRVDRHEHIGDGELGKETFRILLQEHRLTHLPAILETPEAEKMHEENLRRLKELLNGV